MATTSEYRQRQRKTRSITTMSPINKGVFHTDFDVPEGFARVLVNYDLDVNGSKIRTRKGRSSNDIASSVICLKNEYRNNTGSLNPNLKRTVGGVHYVGPLQSAIWYGDLQGQWHMGEPAYEDVALSFGIQQAIGSSVYAQNYLIAGINVVENGITEYRNFIWAVRNKSTYATPLSGPEQFIPAVSSGTSSESRGSSEKFGMIKCKTEPSEGFFNIPFRSFIGEDFPKQPIYTYREGELLVFMSETCTLEEDGSLTIPGDDDGYGRITYRLCRIAINEGSYGVDLESLEYFEISPKQLSVSEASAIGFNMLSDNPYSFTNRTGVHQVLGLLGYQSNTDFSRVIFSPNIGEPLFYRAYLQYTSPETYEWLWEVADASTLEWEQITPGYVSVGSVSTNSVNGQWVTLSHPQSIIKITLRKTGDANSAVVFTTTIIDTQIDSLKTLETSYFDLTSANGMFYWKGLVGLYGVIGGPGTIFFSDINDPSYFPFPQNTHTFNDKILNVIPANENLYVICSNGIYVITGGPSPATMTTKQILTNVSILNRDAQGAKVIKNELFFKANNEFYVLKPNPNTSDSTDLKNYLNSQPIEDFLQDFKGNLSKIIERTYRKEWLQSLGLSSDVTLPTIQELNLVETNSEILDGEVHYATTVWAAYDREGISTILDTFTFVLIYNPQTRSWRYYLEGKEDVSPVDGLVNIPDVKGQNHNKLPYRFLTSRYTGRVYNFVPISVIDQEGDVYNCILPQYSDPNKGSLDTVNGDFQISYHFNNNQLLDTGNVQLQNDIEKRFKEIQVAFNNVSTDNFTMALDFYIDGRRIIDVAKQRQAIVHIPGSMEPTIRTYLSIEDNVDVPGDNKFDEWSLDLSAFKDLSVITLRSELIGKGRRGRAEILTTAQKPHEINSISWVARPMNGR